MAFFVVMFFVWRLSLIIGSGDTRTMVVVNFRNSFSSQSLTCHYDRNCLEGSGTGGKNLKKKIQTTTTLKVVHFIQIIFIRLLV